MNLKWCRGQFLSISAIEEEDTVTNGPAEKPNNQRSRAVTSNGGDFMIYPAAASLPTVSNSGHQSGHHGRGGCGHHGDRGGGCGGGGGDSYYKSKDNVETDNPVYLMAVVVLTAGAVVLILFVILILWLIDKCNDGGNRDAVTNGPAQKPNNHISRDVTSNDGGGYIVYPAAASLPTFSDSGHHGDNH
ncbi:unnamed protein product [Arabidopsis lyrata]|nr:unnamed protein product [Arabidopsis lyrata]